MERRCSGAGEEELGMPPRHLAAREPSTAGAFLEFFRQEERVINS